MTKCATTTSTIAMTRSSPPNKASDPPTRFMNGRMTANRTSASENDNVTWRSP
jgi:hypothetical protein